jgi:predicted RNase H-like nuclease (RuvC/YqgF family)
MSMADMTPPPAANSTATRRSWSQVISKDAEIQRLNMQLCLKNKHIERLETYISELKKKVRAKKKTKAKYKAQIDRFIVLHL